jgi:hypothetical protein
MQTPEAVMWVGSGFNPLNANLNPICQMLALLGGATIVVVSRLRVKKGDVEIYIYKSVVMRYMEYFALGFLLKLHHNHKSFIFRELKATSISLGNKI